MRDDDEEEDGIPRSQIIDVMQLKQLRESNPAGLYRHLNALSQRFVFGVERQEGWGGPFRVLLNRNISLHLVHGFGEDMPDRDHLPQFCVLPSDTRPDTSESHSIFVEDEEIRGMIFWVDPFDLDDLMRDAGRIAEEYPDWDVLPDSYFLDTQLIQWIGRVVLDEPRINTEREFDFRLGYPGLKPQPLEVEEILSAEELIAMEVDPDADDEAPPLTGMRTVIGER